MERPPGELRVNQGLGPAGRAKVARGTQGSKQLLCNPPVGSCFNVVITDATDRQVHPASREGWHGVIASVGPWGGRVWLPGRGPQRGRAKAHSWEMTQGPAEG